MFLQLYLGQGYCKVNDLLKFNDKNLLILRDSMLVFEWFFINIIDQVLFMK